MSGITDYGFEWGPMEVVRACSDAKFGNVILVKSKKRIVQIRVTPSGLIRVGTVEASHELSQ